MRSPSWLWLVDDEIILYGEPGIGRLQAPVGTFIPKVTFAGHAWQA